MSCENEIYQVTLGVISFLLMVSEYLAHTERCDCNSIMEALFPRCYKVKLTEAQEKKIEAVKRAVILELSKAEINI
tara:strand:- start:578 stop:805 length:228 start_codon:yes stop_codon:yes gene_type:complete